MPGRNSRKRENGLECAEKREKYVFFIPIASPLKKKGLLCIFYQLENVLVCVYIGFVAVVKFNIHNIHI